MLDTIPLSLPFGPGSLMVGPNGQPIPNPMAGVPGGTPAGFRPAQPPPAPPRQAPWSGEGASPGYVDAMGGASMPIPSWATAPTARTAASGAPMGLAVSSGAVQPITRAQRIRAMIMGGESGGDRNAHTSQAGQSASGLYGITDGTFEDFLKNGGGATQGFTMDDKDTPRGQEAAFAWLTDRNANFLKQGLGKDASDQQLVYAHMLGPGGALAMLRADPNADAYSVYEGVAGKKVADAAFEHNPGLLVKGAPVGQTLQAIQNYYAGKKGLTPTPVVQVASTPTTPGAQFTDAPQVPQTADPQAAKPIPRQLPFTGMDQSAGPAAPSQTAAVQSPVTQSDKLMALAGGMFAGPTPGVGFAKGVQNMQNLEMQGLDKSLRAQELGAQMAMMGLRAKEYQSLAESRMAPKPFGQPVQRPDGSWVQPFRTVSGQVTYQPLGGQTASAMHATGQTAAAQAGVKDNNAEWRGMMNAGETALTQLPMLTNLYTAIDHAGGAVGPTYVNQFTRWAATRLGMPIGDTDPTAKNLAEYLTGMVKSGQIRQAMGGLGLRSNNEFKTFLEGVAKLDTDPQVLKSVLQQMIRDQQFNAANYKSWTSLPLDQQKQLISNPLAYTNWEAQRRLDYASSNGVQPKVGAPLTPTIVPEAPGTWVYKSPSGQQLNIQRVN